MVLESWEKKNTVRRKDRVLEGIQFCHSNSGGALEFCLLKSKIGIMALGIAVLPQITEERDQMRSDGQNARQSNGDGVSRAVCEFKL